MEIKVREVGGTEAKGAAEVEKELLEQHEQQQNAEPAKTEEAKVEVDAEVTLRDEDVLSYISKRYNKQINSFDELMAEREKGEDLPEDVAAYFKYKKETGRGIQDFIELQKDYETMDQDTLLKQYYLATQEGIDPEDVDVLMDEFKFDEDLDDESTIKKAKLAKKKIVSQAKKFFNEQKEKYRIPAESARAAFPDSEREEFEAYKQYIANAKTEQEESERKRGWFEKKSDEVFGKDFKGFEFTIDNKTMTFTPAGADELRKAQATPMNFISKFLDSDGLMSDAVGYHKALAAAMNPEKFAKYFYEQGKADATDDVMRKTKNINMSETTAPQVISKGDFNIKAVDTDNGRGLKIRSPKK
jgi:hypothetical protein